MDTTPRENSGISGDGAYRTTSYDSTINRVDSVDRDSWSNMAQNLYGDINRLWQKESLLIRTELNEKVSDVKAAVGEFATGGAVLLVGLFALVATAIIVLDIFTPLWLASTIVTAVLLLVGAMLLSKAKKNFEANRLKPTRSIETLGEIKNTFQERIHEFKKH